ncbi:hypothetical protein AAD001_10205 [Colwelliaceae bacterium 6471]
MSVIWMNHASHLSELVSANNEMQAHLYLEQLMLFPIDVQDKIIEEISRLPNCNSESVASIMNRYTIIDME